LSEQYNPYDGWLGRALARASEVNLAGRTQSALSFGSFLTVSMKTNWNSERVKHPWSVRILTRGVENIAITTSDLDRSIDFCVKTLGFAVLKEDGHYSLVLFDRRDGKAEIHPIP